ncbi:hypothetical protein [Deinococcus aluminii]|uniref:Type II toxin-antitoxin system VapC family toxin n=1 Tax=Deinococcus aluminii TaxID=1656885 RepID=A0ABP9XET8_9DEIO
MTTCLDTNVLSALLRNEPGALLWAERLGRARRQGPLLIHASVYAERKRSGGGLPRRLLVDFLIGAHAHTLSAALFTLDPQHYRQAFPDLHVLS